MGLFTPVRLQTDDEIKAAKAKLLRAEQRRAKDRLGSLAREQHDELNQKFLSGELR